MQQQEEKLGPTIDATDTHHEKLLFDDGGFCGERIHRLMKSIEISKPPRKQKREEICCANESWEDYNKIKIFVKQFALSPFSLLINNNSLSIKLNFFWQYVLKLIFASSCLK